MRLEQCHWPLLDLLVETLYPGIHIGEARQVHVLHIGGHDTASKTFSTLILLCLVSRDGEESSIVLRLSLQSLE